MDIPKRKSTRLASCQYSTPGAFFLTICTHNRECLLSRILSVGEGLAPPVVSLTETGKIVEEEIVNLEKRFPEVTLDR